MFEAWKGRQKCELNHAVGCPSYSRHGAHEGRARGCPYITKEKAVLVNMAETRSNARRTDLEVTKTNSLNLSVTLHSILTIAALRPQKRESKTGKSFGLVTSKQGGASALTTRHFPF